MHKFLNKRRHKRIHPIYFYFFLLLTLPAGLANAEQLSIPLSGDMPNFGDVVGGKRSPDGKYVVYRADQETDGVFELFVTPVDGSAAPKRISPDLPPGGSISILFDITSDSKHVVYIFEYPDIHGVMHLKSIHSIPITGGEVTTHHQTWANDRQIFSTSPLISPDGKNVVFFDTNFTTTALYSAPISGGPTVKLFETNDSIGWYLITPDSKRVVFDSGPIYNPRLYSTSINGGTPVLLSPSKPDLSVLFFTITPDSSIVIFGQWGGGSGSNLYKVPISGGATSRLNNPLVPGGGIVNWQISPDGKTLVYTADQDTPGKIELYSVEINSGSVSKLNTPIQGDYDVKIIYPYTYDSQKVVFKVDYDGGLNSELYSSSINGSGLKKLSKDKSGNLLMSDLYLISHDSKKVIYLADHDTDFTLDMYSAPITGGAVKKLNDPIAPGSMIIPNLTSIDGDVVYAVGQHLPELDSLFFTNVNGGKVVKVTDTPVAGGHITSLIDTSYATYNPHLHASTPNCEVYVGDLREDEKFELFCSELPQAYSSSKSLLLTIPTIINWSNNSKN